jgi:signal transduction histidine kinase
MNPAASHLVARVLAWQAAFTLFVSGLVAALAPQFLLLHGPLAVRSALAVGAGVLAGGLPTIVIGAIRLRRYRFLLRALAVGSKAVEAHELYQLADEPRRGIVTWFVPSALGIVLGTLLVRPQELDLATAVTLCLVGLVITAAASLPLFVLLRTTIARALMLAPPEVMREVVEDAERLGHIGKRVSRRILTAVTLPVFFTAIGATLIVAAHVRRADERSREETARIVSRAVLEPSTGRSPWLGVEDAVLQARALGFYAYSSRDPSEYRVERGKSGRLVVTTPLDVGSGTMEFSASTVAVLSPTALAISLVATALAAFFGWLLGRALREDLRAATQDVRELGTEAVMGGGRRVVRSARFRVVARLGMAIARLAGRFRVFARAQERSIAARDAAARTRGMFFASVSHDLKSPLNAILGFTEIVRARPVTPGQGESLDLIERRGRELLALIETILDAARVEAGQLALVLDPMDVGVLLEEAVARGRDLGGDREISISVQTAPGIPPLRADRVRLPRAIATFVAYAVRETVGPSMRIVASPEPNGRARIDVEVPSERLQAVELESLLDPSRAPGTTEHRGLSLALRLGRAIVELHGGSIELDRRAGTETFSLHLPTTA